MQCQPNMGLKRAAQLGYYEKLRRRTEARFQAVLTRINGVAGIVSYANSGVTPAFAVAVLQLHGYHAEQRGEESVVYANDQTATVG